MGRKPDGSFLVANTSPNKTRSLLWAACGRLPKPVNKRVQAAQGKPNQQPRMAVG